MKRGTKDTFLQIRLTSGQKSLIKRSARAQGKNVSSWVLERLLLDRREQLASLIENLAQADNSSFAFAELSDFLQRMDAREFAGVFAEEPRLDLSPETANIFAAMVEFAAMKKGADVPLWLQNIKPLDKPLFATRIKALRPHLLLQSPIPFRKRNLFVDSGIGDRV